MDAWWPKLVEAEFKPALGGKAFEKLEGMIEIGDHHRRLADAPDFDDGWWGYVSKDLRDLFGPKPKGAWSRVYCGDGSKAKCRAVLQRSLARGAEGDAGGSCTAAATATAPPTRSRPASTRTGRAMTSGIELAPFPFQNRPTFQQVVTLTQKLGADAWGGAGTLARGAGSLAQNRGVDQETFAAVDEFVGGTLAPHDEALQGALDAAEAAGLPPIQVSPPQGKLLQICSRGRRRATVLEFGTLGGYSTILLAGRCPRAAG